MNTKPQQTDEISKSLDSIATWLKYLGMGNAHSDGMGAIEFLAVQIKEAGQDQREALREIAESNNEIAAGLHAIAKAILESGRAA